MRSFFNIGYFYFDRKKNQYICKPTGIECTTIEDCKEQITATIGKDIDYRNYSISQFEQVPGKTTPEFIGSWSLDQFIYEENHPSRSKSA